jgi:hypothetical protein
MNIHLVHPTTIIVVPNVSILRTQTMNFNIGYITIHVNHQTTWSQPVTRIIWSKTSMLSTSTYPMWYNVIPLFVPLDPSLYLTYPTKTKGLDSSIFRNYTCYVLGNVYLVHKQLVVPPTYIVSSLTLGLWLSVECKGPWGQENVFRCETRSHKWGKVQGMEPNDSWAHSHFGSCTHAGVANVWNLG